MFIPNRYTQVYWSIVTNARVRGLDKRDHQEYLEWHHIIPTALDGPDVDENKVLLTAREHFLCHLLLTRMLYGKALIRMRHAFSYMATGRSWSHQRHVPSRWYAKAKEFMALPRDSDWCANISIGQTGKKKSKESVEKMRKSLTGRTLTEDHKRRIGENAVGFSSAAREARLMSLQKTYQVHYDNEYEDVINLKAWCLEKGFNYSTANNASKHGKTISSGPLAGYTFIKVSP